MRRLSRSIAVRAILIGFLIAVGSLAAWGSDKKSNERTYAASFERVWTICVRTASENWKVTDSDEASGVLKFRQGVSFKTNSWGVHVLVTVVRVDERHTKVALASEKLDPLELSWAGRNIRKRFFKALDTSLGVPPETAPSATPSSNDN